MIVCPFVRDGDDDVDDVSGGGVTQRCGVVCRGDILILYLSFSLPLYLDAEVLLCCVSDRSLNDRLCYIEAKKFKKKK